MPFYPTLQESRSYQQVTDEFGGYNHNLKIGDGEFYDELNMTADYFPMLANRRRRGTVSALTAPGGLIAKEHMAYVDNGKLYYNGSQVSGITLSAGEKQLVSMGAYIVIWPDKVYYNTADPTDYGSIDKSFTSSGSVTYSICDETGSNIDNIAQTKPENPTAGQYWLDTSTTPHALKRFSAASSMWVTVPAVCVKIGASGIGGGFEQYDGVKLSGISYSGTEPGVAEQYDALNGSKSIRAVGADYIVVTGLVDKNYTQTSGSVTVTRAAPDMDYITEAQNRLWGCKYGQVGGEMINEIYACALGDFKNWSRFEGISTDSYAVSVGTDGPFTGAITHLGYPIFFKENTLHKVFISSTGAHQLRDTACRGVQEGCSRSLAIVGERLFYRSRSGIMMFDGSLPECVSDRLGQTQYYDAAAGALDGKYYISMRDAGGHWHMFVFDTDKGGLWHREDDTHASFFARLGDELYYIDAGSGKLMTVNGSAGTAEGAVHWRADTGLIGYTTVEHKYVSRFNFRMQLPKGSDADMYIQYDSDGIWEFCGHMQGSGTNSFMLPVRPRRCDHFAIRIEGTGDVRIYSMARIFEEGSDVI